MNMLVKFFRIASWSSEVMGF